MADQAGFGKPNKELPCPGPACFHPGVSAAKNFLRYWFPLIIWMALIFTASGDTKSVSHTSLFLEPFLKFFWPNISVDTIDIVRTLVRKLAHATEYAVLAWLWWRALRGSVARDARLWGWKQACLALLLSALYAASDEFHQSFVPEREASVLDVVIDSYGAAVGLMVRWRVGRWRKHW